MPENNPNEDPKIIIDDDWKSQVEKEKSEAQKQSEQAPEADPQGIPPASFPILISTLASQALAGLGAIPDPVQGEPVIQLDLAKHMIDTLGVLDEKTKGNLTPEESEMLTSTLHQLRMAFLSVEQAAAAAGAVAPESPSTGGSSIELP